MLYLMVLVLAGATVWGVLGDGGARAGKIEWVAEIPTEVHSICTFKR